VRSFAVPFLILFAASETWAQELPVDVDAQAARNEFQATTHWAFEPVRPVAVPDDPSGWSAGPIDRFIQAKLAEQGLKPVKAADRPALLRRVFFDLIGLRPEPEDVEDFVADPSPDAWMKVVEGLLASPLCGQRWGRHWMDVDRYADTAGDNADYPVPEARLYRDYIIDAFNADKPFDQFVREQLAGDILARQAQPAAENSAQPAAENSAQPAAENTAQPAAENTAQPDRASYAEKVAATGFLAVSRRYGTGPYELWHLTLEDAIDTTGRAFMGLSLRCARCHDHKFEPVTAEDYYGLYGIFASTQFPWAGSEEVQSKKFDRMKFVPLAPADEAAIKLAVYQKRIVELEAEIKQLEAATDDQAKARLAELCDQLRNLKKPGLPDDLPGAYAAVVETRVHMAGEPDQLGDAVPRCLPRFLAGNEPLAIPAGASGRLPFAEWLTRHDHPLTARVMVNRAWQHHFGRGLVATPSNFGTSGEPPTHPELLDWLARQFVERGWSVKAIHRLILMSNTYQQASSVDAATATHDPSNRWHARFDRRRLDAEAIRDALLSVAGRLDLSRPGEHPFPPIAAWSWTQHNPFKAVYPSNYRSVYLMTQRIQRHPYLALFDGPDPNVSTDVRTSATVPLQALYSMNNPFVTEQAAAFAKRLSDFGLDLRGRINLAHQLAYARPSRPEENERGAEYIEAYQQELVHSGVTAAEAQLEALTSYARVLLTANEFVYVD